MLSSSFPSPCFMQRLEGLRSQLGESMCGAADLAVHPATAISEHPGRTKNLRKHPKGGLLSSRSQQ